MDVSLWVRFTATERRERGAAHRVLIEPSLDDPCTALCIIDRAPKPRAADGKCRSVMTDWVPIVALLARREFKQLHWDHKPPRDHHI